jgi:hypothetical protein
MRLHRSIPVPITVIALTGSAAPAYASAAHQAPSGSRTREPSAGTLLAALYQLTGDLKRPAATVLAPSSDTNPDRLRATPPGHPPRSQPCPR